VARASSELETASRHDEDLTAVLQRLGGLSAELEDVLYELRSYVDELEADPGRLETVEDRLAAMRALERKYGDVEGYLEESRARLSRLENLDEETAALEARLAEGEGRLAELAPRSRRAASGRRRGSPRRCRRTSGT
jgi:DNA repair protein RecN (Recombination protein N)